jgi:hypothetical protein
LISRELLYQPSFKISKGVLISKGPLREEFTPGGSVWRANYFIPLCKEEWAPLIVFYKWPTILFLYARRSGALNCICPFLPLIDME